MWKSIHNVSTRIQLRSASVSGVRAWTRVGQVGTLVFCLVGALAATAPHSPANMSYVWPDSGTFQYVGHRLLEGNVLYRDVWDNKPPLIYWLNALGVWLGGGGRWGVWVLSFIAVASAVSLSVYILRQAFGSLIALVVTNMWLLAYVQLINDGNMTEEFALPLQFACLLLAWKVESKYQGNYKWRGFLIGILVGILFFLKANAIGVGIAIGLAILWEAFTKRRWGYLIKNLAPIFAGGILITSIVLGILWAQGILSEFFLILFQYNVIYAERFSLIQGTLDALGAGFDFLSLSGLAIFGLVGFSSGVTCYMIARARIPAPWLSLFRICAAALPIEMILVTFTRRGFDHYFVVLFYVLAVWSGFALWLVRRAVLTFAVPTTSRVRAQLTLGLTCGIAILLLPAFYHDIQFVRELHTLEPPHVVDYIREHTVPDNTVLILGYEPRVLLFSERRAPTRFVHTIPFEFARFASVALVEDYFAEVLAKEPALIIDTRNYGLNDFTPADSPKIQRQINLLRNEYRSVGQMSGWTVYEHVLQ